MARYSESTSPDSTSSPMFPDRPIHPLPKRRLRERLSPEVADSIEYPPTPPTTVFYYPYKEEEPETCNGNHCTNGAMPHGEEEDSSRLRRSQAVPRSAPSLRSMPVRLAQKQDSVYGAYTQLPHSTASSVDGYDTFENTNNKKKRKVPDTTLGHSLNDLGAGQSSPSTPVRVVHQDGCDASCSAYHAMGSGSPGLSGPGRGRFGRNRSGRSPLSESNRNNKMRPAMRWSPLSAPSPGIISNAISKVDKHPSSHQGQENVSLLELQRSSKSGPGSSQFTFTCESQVPGSASWPGSHGRPPNVAPVPPRHDVSCHSSRPPWPSGLPADHHSGQVPTNSRPMPGPPGGQLPPPRPRRRRTKAAEYAKAAQDRQAQKQHDKCRGIHDEEHWLCLFCEYEDIFGEKPMALIRSYEKKDRQRRKDEAERRRLLEKAKARGRKGKKPAVGKGATGKGVHDPAHDYHGHGPHEPMSGGLHSHNHDHHTCGQHGTHHHHHHHHCSGPHSVHCDDPNHHEYEDEHDYHGHHEYDDHYDDVVSPDGDAPGMLDSKNSDSGEGHLHKRVAAGIGSGSGASPGHARPPDMAAAAAAARNGPPPVRV